MTSNKTRTDYIGIDPGEITGLCSLEPSEGRPIASGDFSFTDLVQALWAMFDYRENVLENRSLTVVMESAVKTGRLTKGKVQQLQTIGAVYALCSLFRKVHLVEVPPEYRKRVKKIPSNVTLPHSRDAYRIVYSYYLEDENS